MYTSIFWRILQIESIVSDQTSSAIDAITSVAFTIPDGVNIVANFAVRSPSAVVNAVRSLWILSNPGG